MIEILLLDEGVVVLCNRGLAGDWAVPTGEWNGCSGVPIGVENCSASGKVFGGGCNDFVFVCRVDESKYPGFLSEAFRLTGDSGTSGDLLASPRPACARLGL